MKSSVRAPLPRLIVLLALVLAASTAMAEQGWYSFPALSAEQLVFTCEGDLWSVPAEGGTAHRLTHALGAERWARFSPDGSLLAFTGEYDGNPDVYVMDARGGEPRRLTFHPGNDEVMAWSPEGDRIFFRSRRDSAHYEHGIFQVSLEGGLPSRLPLGPAALVSFEPQGSRVAFNRFSREFRNWKRYLGGRAQQIWVGDPERQEFAQVTDFKGTDAFPMWLGDRIYFLSDRDGTGNLYSFLPDGSDLRQHTEEAELDIRWPSAGAGSICYQLGADIHRLDLESGESRLVPIQLPSDRRRTRTRYVKAPDYFQGFELSPEGKQIALEARGDLALMPVKEARVIELTGTPGAREKSPRWSRDGLELAYLSDESGEDRLMIRPALDGAEAEALGELPPGWYYEPAWAPDGRRIALSDMRGALRVVDRKSGATVEVDRSDNGEIRDYRWSPDSRWLAYSRNEPNDLSSIFLYEVATGTVTPVTDRWTSDWDPVWDPEGKYLYFLSDRNVEPHFGELDYEFILDRATKICAVLLKADQKSPFLPRMIDEQEEGDDWEDWGEDGDGPDGDRSGRKKGKGKRGKGKKDAEEKNEEWRQVEVTVDLPGIQRRIYPFPVPASRYSDLEAAKSRIYFLDHPPRSRYREPPIEEEEGPRSGLHYYDLKERKQDILAEGIDGYDLAAGGERVALLRHGSIEVRQAKEKDWGGPKKEPETVDLARWRIRVEPREEWRQIFHEAWRRQRDFYWSEDMAGVDWPALRDRYEPFLERLGTRAELTDLTGQLIGELATSHTYLWGGDQQSVQRVPVGMLGAELEPAGKFYRFSRIFAGENWDARSVSPLAHSHADVKVGEYLIAVNGRELHPPESPHLLLSHKAGEAVRLTVGPKPSTRGARDVVVELLGGDGRLRYLDWVESRRQAVTEATGGRVGYLHIPDMGGLGLHEFARSFYPQTDRDALIIDVRFNGGGSVSQLVLERLYRRIVGYDLSRHFGLERYPYRAFHGPLVVITNQHAGSDGDIFTRAFQLYDLGPVIGMRSWGGVVGIRMDKRFMDGGAMSEPEFAYYFLEDGWDEENRGTIPDIEVENDPASLVAGRDPQLEKAIQVIQERLEGWPAEPEMPPAPDKSKDAFRKRSDLYE